MRMTRGCRVYGKGCHVYGKGLPLYSRVAAEFAMKICHDGYKRLPKLAEGYLAGKLQQPEDSSLFLLRGLCYLFSRGLRQREQQDFSPGKLGVGLTQAWSTVSSLVLSNANKWTKIEVNFILFYYWVYFCQPLRSYDKN